MRTLVMKFGGTSMGDSARIRQCADLVQRERGAARAVAVVSAMSGVTDTLLALAAAAAQGDGATVTRLLADLRQRHERAAAELGAQPAVAPLLDRLELLVSGIAAVGELTPRSRDAVAAFGEKLSVPLMAAALGGSGLTGQEAGIVTDDNFGEAEPLLDLTLYHVREVLGPRVARGEALAVTGFIAATQHGVTTTIGRGGSDYTATILGAALRADEIWIWSDVDGLMSANPKLVPAARLLDAITFAEAIEMGQFGAKSMHPRALEPAAQYGIPVRMRNTFNPDCPGTLIGPAGADDRVARSALAVTHAALITVAGAAMIGRPGTAARVFSALSEAGVNVQMISQSVSEAGISLVVAGAQLERATAVMRGQLLRTGVARDIEVDPAVAVVALIGSGMRGTPGVAARVFGAVAARRINVIAIAQGSSQLSISFVVPAADAAGAVLALHEEFRLGQ